MSGLVIWIESASVVVNNYESMVEQTIYEPCGSVLEGGQESRYSYEGKEFSSVTKDFDFHFRKYDPELGIFTARRSTS